MFDQKMTVQFDQFEYVDLVEERFRCTSCNLPLMEAMTAACSHSFCRLCAEQQNLNTCPADGKELGLLFPNCDANVQLRKLKIYCRNKNNGCCWVGLRDSWENHKELCVFQTVDCPYGCKFSNLFRKDLDDHKKRCNNRILVCECGVHLKMIEFESHRTDDCPKVQIVCESCSHKLLRGDLHQHIETECPEYIIECIHARLGCNSKFLRKNFELHLQSCAYEPLKDFISKTLDNILEMQKTIKDLKKKVEKLTHGKKRRADDSGVDDSEDETKKKKRKKGKKGP